MFLVFEEYDCDICLSMNCSELEQEKRNTNSNICFFFTLEMIEL